MPLPAHAHVVVVGAGLAGTAVALFLAEAGWAPVVLEARSSPGHALSGRATGLGLPVLTDTPPAPASNMPGCSSLMEYSR